MRDLSYLIGLFGIAFLALAGVAWWRIIRKPDQVPPTAKNERRSGRAAKMVVIAFGLCAAAAFVALVGMIAR